MSGKMSGGVPQGTTTQYSRATDAQIPFRMAGVVMTVARVPTEVRAVADRDLDASDYLEGARALVPLIESEAEEGERTRTVTDRVAQAIRESGLPWMLVPKSLGGGLRIADCVEVDESITAEDALVGWILQAHAPTGRAASSSGLKITGRWSFGSAPSTRTTPAAATCSAAVVRHSGGAMHA
jgi:alkylation response protein AidB-like acyl-CoA dehydrogenase